MNTIVNRTEEALQIAKDNLEAFLVVGLTEELPETMQVIERLMPDFFKGLVREYRKKSKSKLIVILKAIACVRWFQIYSSYRTKVNQISFFSHVYNTVSKISIP